MLLLLSNYLISIISELWGHDRLQNVQKQKVCFSNLFIEGKQISTLNLVDIFAFF